ncbi:HAMP domain-containing protein [Amantichitinum ursilacus]|uniref:Chemotaxis protein CheA n=1 Tax=Amantichitinum ursilacus TaxID=857265 RepID=A0A0N0GQ39_9NEIS|nr:HAMP domain-containing protein [Amantichitinum ursilacus]KPC54275.1 Chemotaxis protein CheA [Amantichitinum ursilacus]
MTIRQRIILLTLLTFAAIAAIGGYAMLQAHHNAADVKRVTEGVVPSTLASADLVAGLKDVQLATMALVFAPDANTLAQAADKLAQQQNHLRQALTLQLQQASNATQKGLVQQAQQSVASYFGAIDDTVKFKQAGQQDIAEANLFASVAQYQGELEQVIETLRVEKNRSKDDAINALNHSLARTATTLSGVTTVAVLILGAIGVMLYRQIVRPIGQMQSMMSNVAASQDFTQRLPVARQDEIGRSMLAFNTMIEQIQASSSQLKQKTTDIQSMLQNMPQGILTVQAQKVVHPEYSAYLATILETEEIAGRDVMDLLFSNTQLGADTLAQIDAVWGACIDEDAMNFDFNQHLMVGEIEKTMRDGRVKILDLNWSPILDDDGNTCRVMLCVRDVTELRQLAAEASEQRQELEIIGEVLAVSQDKFHDFIIGALRFIEDNQALIRLHPKGDAEAIAQLFRNMHTIKGNARTYGLQHLTHIVHQAEHTYEALRQPRPDVPWDPRMLLDELAQVRAAVERYARINEVSLGRKGPGKGQGEQYLLVDRGQVHDALHRLETVNTNNLIELVAARDAVRKALRLLGTEPLSQTLDSVIESLPRLAAELGKLAPRVVLADHGYVVRHQASGLLKNVFMHLMRNALDHGIEDADTRMGHGKTMAGTLKLHVAAHDAQVYLTLNDDGRGLALHRIRDIARARQLLPADAHPTDEQIARLVFLPGFSTAAVVTEISGRGVGMDAVQEFVRRERGDIAIRFEDQRVGAAFRAFSTVVTLPEALFEHIDTPVIHGVSTSAAATV